MTNTPSDEWPDPSYHIGQRDHLHALGVITASYNQLEFVFLMFFMRHLSLDSVSAQRIFALLSNPHRIDLTRDAVEATEKDPSKKEMILYFIKGFETLANTRNFLAHSHTIFNDPAQEHLTFGKGSKRQPDRWSFAHMKLGDLRHVAEDMMAFRTYGFELDWWLIAQRSGGTIIFPGGQTDTPALPEKPPLPEALISVPHGTLEQ